VLPFFMFFLFPYANDKRCERFPVATFSLIAVNGLAFAGELWLRASGHWDVVQALIYKPGETGWYTMLTSPFLHAGFLHLATNLWFFRLIGGQVEERMGSSLFVLFYLGGGIFSSLGHALYCRLVGQTVGILGASGCVYAVLGAYFILYPFEEFRFWYFFFMRWGTIKIATLFFVAYWVLSDVVSAYSDFLDFERVRVAHWAHLGGLAFGVAVALTAFGAYPFTGKRRLTPDEKADQRRLRRIARRKFYSDGLLPEPMSEEELQAATEDVSPAEAIRRGLFFHNGRMIEWGYQELLFQNPKACLEPAMHLQMIEMLRVHGREALAQVGAWNLLQAHPQSPEAIQTRLELARSLATLPEMHGEAARLLREFLAAEPAMRERAEAERLLRRLEDRPLWQWK